MSSLAKSRMALLVVYLIAFTLGFWVSTVSDYPVLLKSAIAVAVSVAIIFLGSLDFNNSSVFDPYWSLAPPLMVVYYIVMYHCAVLFDAGQTSIDAGQWSLLTGKMTENTGTADGFIVPWYYSPRILLVLILTAVYSLRLTWNFLRGWPGLRHEDWRYRGFREKTGKAYWLVSFSAIHFFPAIMVFGGTLSVWVVVIQATRPLNILDLFALLVTANAILLETVADRQLRKFTLSGGGNGTTLKTGLWSLSRHPNYLGEILFWWGLYLFAFSANPGFWWVVAGPVAITLMFLFASIPMIEKRMMKRRSDYGEYRKRVPMLIPWKTG